MVSDSFQNWRGMRESGGPVSYTHLVDVEMSDVYQSFRRFAYYNIKAKELKKIGKNGILQMDIQLSPGNYSIAFNQEMCIRDRVNSS